MNILEMQYDFKQKLNKIDSQQYRNLRIPEIDWKLNEGIDIFIKSISQPRQYNNLGFERTQRTIDDIRTLVINNLELSATEINSKEYFVELPEDYMFYVSSYSTLNKVSCNEAIEVRNTLVQHDDEHEESLFDASSFEWREVNIRFYEGGIKIFTDGTFTIDSIRLNYIRKHAYVHNANGFLPSNSYNLPGGATLVGTQDCELPEHTHREIVDIAVLITTGDLDMPNYQIKEGKVRLNQN